MSASLQAALTIRNRSSSRRVIIRSSRMPPSSLVKKRVALLARRQVDHVDRHQRSRAPPRHRRRSGAAGPCARRRTAPPTSRQCRCSARMPAGYDTGIVVAGERHHLRAELEVQRVQRRLQQRRRTMAVVGSEGMAAPEQFDTRAPMPHRDDCPLLSALPERLAAPRTAAACPFGGPARGGPLSSEERLAIASACQSFCLSVRRDPIGPSAPSAAPRDEALSWRRRSVAAGSPRGLDNPQP